MLPLEDQIAGCIVGGAVGDAMGLPFEGQAGPLAYAPPTDWMVSDDTQLTLATCEAIVQAEEVSPKRIARELCRWFQEGRVDRIGASTLKALRDLAAGGHWALVGRKGEMAAGNGAAMRIAPLGVMLDTGNQADRVVLRDVSRITHHNEEAYVGALAVAAAIHAMAFEQYVLGPTLLTAIGKMLPDSNVGDRLARLREFVEGHTIQDCGAHFGSSGYVVESVPLALAAVSYLPRLGFQGMLEAIIECGGDTDTTASIAGQIAGAASGFSGLPSTLVDRVPHLARMRQLARHLAELKNRPYSRSELIGMADGAGPNRGEYCKKCHAWIPRFADIADEEVARIRSLSPARATMKLKEMTGCSTGWAKIWVTHPNGPSRRDAGPPCPNCGGQLRTPKAQQCLHCGADWHSANVPGRLEE